MTVQVSTAAQAELRAKSTESFAVWVHGSRQYLVQIITNLLSNAIKFTDAGSVHLECKLGVEGVNSAGSPPGTPNASDDVGERDRNAVQNSERGVPPTTNCDISSTTGSVAGTSWDGLFDDGAPNHAADGSDGPGTVPAWISRGQAATTHQSTEEDGHAAVSVPAWIKSTEPKQHSNDSDASTGQAPAWINDGVTNVSAGDNGEAPPALSWTSNGQASNTESSNRTPMRDSSSKSSSATASWIGLGISTVVETANVRDSGSATGSCTAASTATSTNNSPATTTSPFAQQEGDHEAVGDGHGVSEYDDIFADSVVALGASQSTSNDVVGPQYQRPRIRRRHSGGKLLTM